MSSLNETVEPANHCPGLSYKGNLRAGFVYSVDRAFVSSCRTPCLVLAGNEEAHPFPISEEVAKPLPNAEFKVRIKEFLAKHTPGRG